VRIDGKLVRLSAPKDASMLGISMVYQETSLVPQLTVAQNIVLGRERAFNSVRRTRSAARQILQRLNFNVEPSQLAGSLSAAKRQMVEIARAVLNDARVIILDEPTAALTPEETDHLFELMRTLQKRGVAMIFISHALEEALSHADRITVLRNGRLMVTAPAKEFDRGRLIHHMIGEDLKERKTPAGRQARPRVRGASLARRKHSNGQLGQQHVLFDLRRRNNGHSRAYRLRKKRSGQGHHGPYEAQLQRWSDLALRA